MIPSAEHRRFLQEMKAHTGQDPARCYQCAKCSASCPVTDAMDRATGDSPAAAGLEKGASTPDLRHLSPVPPAAPDRPGPIMEGA